MKISKIEIFNNNQTKIFQKNLNFSAKPPLESFTKLSKDVLEKKMTEKEKMLAGVMYFAGDAELRKDLEFAQDLWFKFNNLHPSKIKEKKQIIKQLLGKTGEHFIIKPDFKCDYGYNIEIGERFFANYNLLILDTAKVTFGDNVLIGPNCSFYTAEHPLDPVIRATGQQIAKPIKVGNNVWFGGNVTVLGGVNIGDNVVVGAGSVVTKDLPSNTLCIGTPCRPVKQIPINKK